MGISRQTPACCQKWHLHQVFSLVCRNTGIPYDAIAWAVTPIKHGEAATSGGRSPKGGTPVGPNSSHVCHQHLARYHEISLRSCQNPPLSPLLHGICYTTQQGRWQQGHNIFHFTPGHCAVISPLVRHITITHFQDQGNTHYDDIITSMPTEK